MILLSRWQTYPKQLIFRLAVHSIWRGPVSVINIRLLFKFMIFVASRQALLAQSMRIQSLIYFVKSEGKINSYYNLLYIQVKDSIL